MKKNIEQRIKELEKQVNAINTKDDSKKFESLKTYTPDEHSWEDYCKSPLVQSYYLSNSSINLISEPDIETAFPSPFDKSELDNFPLDTITVTVPTQLDADMGGISPDQQNLSFEDYPQYLNIIGSWDENPDDVVDEYGFKYNHSK